DYGINPLTGNSLMQGANGLLYGMTTFGGSSNKGVLFCINPSNQDLASTYSKLIDFNGTNGAKPECSLMQASNGLLYAMTDSGGTNNRGVLFSLNPVSN